MLGKEDKQKKQAITEITSVIAHQLKTPLSGIKSSLELILEGDLGHVNPEQREYMSMALDKTEKVIELIKNFLDASRIDEDRMELSQDAKVLTDNDADNKPTAHNEPKRFMTTTSTTTTTTNCYSI